MAYDTLKTGGSYGYTGTANLPKASTGYPQAAKTPPIAVAYYTKKTAKMFEIAEKDYHHARFMDNETIPNRYGNTITVQRWEPIPGAGLALDPATAATHTNNAFMLDPDTAESKNPVFLDRNTYQLTIDLLGIYIRVNEVSNTQDYLNILDQAATALPRAIVETKDILARNVILRASTHKWIKTYDKSTGVFDDTATSFADVGGDLPLEALISYAMMFDKNTVLRRNPDLKDGSTWDAYKEGTDASVLVEHDAPIPSFADGCYKVLLSTDGYNSIVYSDLFLNYFVLGKALQGPATNTNYFTSGRGREDTIFNVRLIETKNTFKPKAGTNYTWGNVPSGTNLDSAIILPMGTFTKVNIEGSDGSGMFISKFAASAFDPLGRSATFGMKQWFGCGSTLGEKYSMPAITVFYKPGA